MRLLPSPLDSGAARSPYRVFAPTAAERGGTDATAFRLARGSSGERMIPIEVKAKGAERLADRAGLPRLRGDDGRIAPSEGRNT
jgi:hypothetical protein